MPRRLVQPFIDAGRLFCEEEIPTFTIPVHLAWRESLNSDTLAVVMQSIEAITKQALNNTLPPPFWESE